MDENFVAEDYINLFEQQEVQKPFNIIIPEMFEKRPQRIIEIYYAARTIDPRDGRID